MMYHNLGSHACWCRCYGVRYPLLSTTERRIATTKLSKMIIVAAVAVTVTALLATAAAADTSSGDLPPVGGGGETDLPPVDGSLDGPPPGGETIEDLPSVDGFVEEFPPAYLLKKLPDEPTRFTRTEGRGTDGHYCNSFYIKHVSYTFYYDDPDNANEDTRIHVQPTRRYRLLLSSIGLSGAGFATAAWNALANCISTGGPHGIHVRRWDAIEDQFLCHAVVGAVAGSSWDLKGHRTATNLCNW